MQRADQIRQTIESTQSSMKQQVSQLTAEAAELQAEEELQAEAAQQSAAAARASSSYIDASQCQFVDGNGRLANPCPAGTLSSGFGYRDFDSAFHKGIDLAAAEGTPYYAADSGTVIYATNDGSYNGGAGNWIVIAHGDGLVTKYMHSSAVFVSVGDTVTRGQLIGAVGNTGDSYGAHLHFQVELNGTAVNPFLYL
jgi:murein DD-endopeptidase MepM/ murein hydrolase activator NlpD